jgi:iron(III) transport system ATP-binding protein
MITLECIDLHKRYQQIAALRGFNLSVRAGQIVTLLGPSGGGKTTALRLIAGFEMPDAGQILINGQLIAGNGVFVPPENRRVGMVFQEYALFPHLTVFDNVVFGLSGSAADKAARAKEMLTLVGLEDTAKRFPHELSGGQQQRIALARALAPRPQIVLLDEPFSNLDASLRAQVRREVRAILKSTGTTCIFVTHDQREAFTLSDEVAILLNGTMAQLGTPRMVYTQPATREVAAFVGETNLLPGEANGAMVTCILGTLPLDIHTFGKVDVLIRPEIIRLTRDPQGNASVQWSDYYGVSQRVGVILSDGTPLTVRADPAEIYDVEDVVRVEVEGQVWAFGE